MAMRANHETPSTAQTVREYIAARPAIRESLALGIINHSALARRIADEEKLTRPDAVLKALTRLQDELEPVELTKALRTSLKATRLEIRTRVGMLTCKSNWRVLEAVTRRAKAITEDDERIHILHGWDALTVVANQATLANLRDGLAEADVLEYRDGLTELNMRTADPLDTTPGFIATISRTLFERGIIVVDATTCRRDHIFLVDQDDLTEAVEALETLLD